MQSQKEIVDTYLSFLDQQFISDKKIGFGWYRDLKRHRVGNVATAQITLVYDQVGKQIPEAESVFKKIFENKLPNGSWPFISNIDDVGVVDSTAWVLLALLSPQATCFYQKKDLEESLTWLLSSQNSDGGWGLIEGVESRIVSTAFAMRTLSAVKSSEYQTQIQDGASYILKNQNPDYSWNNFSAKPCVGVTSHAILALLSCCSNNSSLNIKRATSWLSSKCRLDDNVFWDHLHLLEEVEVISENRIRRIFYDYPVTPLAITALRQSHSPSNLDGTDIFDKYFKAIASHKTFIGTKTMNGNDTSYGVHDILMSICERQDPQNQLKKSNNLDMDDFSKEVNDADLPQLFKINQSNSISANTINLVFVHGLGGHSIDTWLNTQSKCFLPTALLNNNPNLNIYTLGYDNSSSTWSGNAMSIYDRTKNIIQLLENKKLDDNKIVFVGHSFGGLLIKSIISGIHSNEAKNSAIKPILNKIAGVCFIATPHLGSKLADFAVSLSKIYSASLATKDLSWLNEDLTRLNDQYKTIANDLGIKHISFAETKKIKGLLVVDELSANIGISDARVVPIDADHIEIAKPKQQNSLIVESIQGFLENCSNDKVS